MATLRIASIASEVAPYSKTGGLGDVAKALPKALSQLGHKVNIITPYYGFIKQQNLELLDVPLKISVTVGKQKFPITIKRLHITDTLSVYFIGNERLFGRKTKVYGYPNDNLRFYVFNVAAVKFLNIKRGKPDIIHCHDWQSGLVPSIIKHNTTTFSGLKSSATLFTIHNLTFQMSGNWWSVKPKNIDGGHSNPLRTSAANIKYLNFTKRAIFDADLLNTVSERYAEEITSPELGQGLDKYLRHRKKDLWGIINGIDYAVHNPSFDDNLKYKFDWNSLGRKKKNKALLQKMVGLEQRADIPVIGIVNRLTEQKGFSLIMENIDTLLTMPLQMVIVGSGYKEYITFFKKIAKKYPNRIGIYTPFTEEMESKVYAGSDMFLMPSRFEPCGISQMKSLRYGSIPIVHETGGLSDTISNFNPRTGNGNGFVFRQFTATDFLMALARAIENYKYPQSWEYLTWKAMQQSYSWKLPAKKYVRLFTIAIKNKKTRK